MGLISIPMRGEIRPRPNAIGIHITHQNHLVNMQCQMLSPGGLRVVRYRLVIPNLPMRRCPDVGETEKIKGEGHKGEMGRINSPYGVRKVVKRFRSKTNR